MLIDSLLMHRFVPSTARAYLQNAKQARRAFTPYPSSSATFRTAAINMASSKLEDAAKRASDITIDPEDPTKDSNAQPLPLPPPPTEDEARKLDISSGEASVKMDHLGPLVVNKDGTLSRIGNWEQMTELEKKNTLRILGKRNQLRTEALKAGEGEQGAEGS
ncbi:uncharacterized protein MYCFIDRAFT_153721 [Pseudocercospora fijiensis CIRAD86]|uniref:Uncharacterized protein n=1 Tax=Pseudocercospora fijiensis (strain CIRAD86) TaxID=383855 RepID=M3B0S6_PSEFD|nr:uncharacterized protein MYCFIDRAFT_153721 [Pseudocercospora fijiensis CIRAD86]EME83042.1 hypothetical protein MYCFIDRAFT_153721 [Pseudocercospora fijiensis CIRAD86]